MSPICIIAILAAAITMSSAQQLNWNIDPQHADWGTKGLPKADVWSLYEEQSKGSGTTASLTIDNAAYNAVFNGSSWTITSSIKTTDSAIVTFWTSGLPNTVPTDVANALFTAQNSGQKGAAVNIDGVQYTAKYASGKWQLTSPSGDAFNLVINQPAAAGGSTTWTVDRGTGTFYSSDASGVVSTSTRQLDYQVANSLIDAQKNGLTTTTSVINGITYTAKYANGKWTLTNPKNTNDVFQLAFDATAAVPTTPSQLTYSISGNTNTKSVDGDAAYRLFQAQNSGKTSETVSIGGKSYNAVYANGKWTLKSADGDTFALSLAQTATSVDQTAAKTLLDAQNAGTTTVPLTIGGQQYTAVYSNGKWQLSSPAGDSFQLSLATKPDGTIASDISRPVTQIVNGQSVSSAWTTTNNQVVNYEIAQQLLTAQKNGQTTVPPVVIDGKTYNANLVNGKWVLTNAANPLDQFGLNFNTPVISPTTSELKWTVSNPNVSLSAANAWQLQNATNFGLTTIQVPIAGVMHTAQLVNGQWQLTNPTTSQTFNVGLTTQAPSTTKTITVPSYAAQDLFNADNKGQTSTTTTIGGVTYNAQKVNGKWVLTSQTNPKDNFQLQLSTNTKPDGSTTLEWAVQQPIQNATVLPVFQVANQATQPLPLDVINILNTATLNGQNMTVVTVGGVQYQAVNNPATGQWTLTNPANSADFKTISLQSPESQVSTILKNANDQQLTTVQVPVNNIQYTAVKNPTTGEWILTNPNQPTEPKIVYIQSTDPTQPNQLVTQSPSIFTPQVIQQLQSLPANQNSATVTIGNTNYPAVRDTVTGQWSVTTPAGDKQAITFPVTGDFVRTALETAAASNQNNLLVTGPNGVYNATRNPTTGQFTLVNTQNPADVQYITIPTTPQVFTLPGGQTTQVIQEQSTVPTGNIPDSVITQLISTKPGQSTPVVVDGKTYNVVQNTDGKFTLTNPSNPSDYKIITIPATQQQQQTQQPGQTFVINQPVVQKPAGITYNVKTDGSAPAFPFNTQNALQLQEAAQKGQTETTIKLPDGTTVTAKQAANGQWILTNPTGVTQVVTVGDKSTQQVPVQTVSPADPTKTVFTTTNGPQTVPNTGVSNTLNNIPVDVTQKLFQESESIKNGNAPAPQTFTINSQTYQSVYNPVTGKFDLVNTQNPSDKLAIQVQSVTSPTGQPQITYQIEKPLSNGQTVSSGGGQQTLTYTINPTGTTSTVKNIPQDVAFALLSAKENGVTNPTVVIDSRTYTGQMDPTTGEWKLTNTKTPSDVVVVGLNSGTTFVPSTTNPGQETASTITYVTTLPAGSTSTVQQIPLSTTYQLQQAQQTGQTSTPVKIGEQTYQATLSPTGTWQLVNTANPSDKVDVTLNQQTTIPTTQIPVGSQSPSFQVDPTSANVLYQQQIAKTPSSVVTIGSQQYTSTLNPTTNQFTLVNNANPLDTFTIDQLKNNGGQLQWTTNTTTGTQSGGSQMINVVGGTQLPSNVLTQLYTSQALATPQNPPATQTVTINGQTYTVIYNTTTMEWMFTNQNNPTDTFTQRISGQATEVIQTPLQVTGGTQTTSSVQWQTKGVNAPVITSDVAALLYTQQQQGFTTSTVTIGGVTYNAVLNNGIWTLTSSDGMSTFQLGLTGTGSSNSVNFGTSVSPNQIDQATGVMLLTAQESKDATQYTQSVAIGGKLFTATYDTATKKWTLVNQADPADSFQLVLTRSGADGLTLNYELLAADGQSINGGGQNLIITRMASSTSTINSIGNDAALALYNAQRNGQTSVTITIGGQQLTANWNTATGTWDMTDANGGLLSLSIASGDVEFNDSNQPPTSPSPSPPSPPLPPMNAPAPVTGNDNFGCGCACTPKYSSSAGCQLDLQIECPNKEVKGLTTAQNAWCELSNKNLCWPAEGKIDALAFTISDVDGNVIDGAKIKTKLLDSRTGIYHINLGNPADEGTVSVLPAADSTASPAEAKWTAGAAASCESSGSSLWPLWFLLGASLCGVVGGLGYYLKSRNTGTGAKYDDFDTTYQNMDNSKV